MRHAIRPKLLRSFVAKAVNVGEAAKEMLKFCAKAMDQSALFRHLNMLLIFATAYNSDGLGLPILPPNDVNNAESIEQPEEEPAFRSLSPEGFLAAFATLCVRNHEIVATANIDIPSTVCPTACNPPNIPPDQKISTFFSIKNPEFARNEKAPYVTEATTSASTKGKGKASQGKGNPSKGKLQQTLSKGTEKGSKGAGQKSSEGMQKGSGGRRDSESPAESTPKYFYTLSRSGNPLDVEPESATLWWDRIW